MWIRGKIVFPVVCGIYTFIVLFFSSVRCYLSAVDISVDMVHIRIHYTALALSELYK